MSRKFRFKKSQPAPRAAELGETLAQRAAATAAMVADIKTRVATGPLTPEKVLKVQPTEATMTQLRAKVGKLLQRGYAKGAQTAVDEIEQTRERPIKSTAPEPAD